MRKDKYHILYIVVIAILFSFITISNSNIGGNSNNVSALSYSSSVGIGFTFNPTLSVSLSSSDLVISNLTPGSTANSNSINVSVASNASYGYTLSAMVNGNNNDLTHSNGTNVFSSIATNADLSSLDNSEDTNIWGYSYKDNTVVSPTWSNYNGLSSSNSTTLINTNNNVSSNLDFRIAAKASNTQPSGTYTGIINFTAVSNVAPMSLLDSFIASGAEQLNGYFKMQDMTHDICSNVDIEESELQLIDVRDNKIYWVAKLKDGNCWMTQNLDLDMSSNTTLNSDTTDLNAIYNPSTGQYAEYNNGYTVNNDTINWIPVNNTIVFQNATVTNWKDSNTEPYSADKIDDISLGHMSFGNYYNWTAAIASNDSSTLTQNTLSNISNNPQNSICPKGWRLPTISNQSETLTGSTNEFARLAYLYDGVTNLLNAPLYYIYSGFVWRKALQSFNSRGMYISSTSYYTVDIWVLEFGTTNSPNSGQNKNAGWSVRCTAK